MRHSKLYRDLKDFPDLYIFRKYSNEDIGYSIGKVGQMD
jgi:hypothetical protein